MLGLGRGLGPVEFDGFRLDMGESRQRFIEYCAAVSEGLETGVMETDGELYQQPRTEIHPIGVASFRGRTYATAVSPESARICADLGYGLMLIAQKPWETVVRETAECREVFLEVNGHEPPQPVIMNIGVVNRSGSKARELHEQYVTAYSRSTVEHYDFTNPRLENINGYEYYAGLRRNIEKHGIAQFTKFLTDLQVSGTPDEVVEETVERARVLEAGGVINVLNAGGMSPEIAQENFDTYADEVLPRLREIDPHRDICVPIRGERSPAA